MYFVDLGIQASDVGTGQHLVGQPVQQLLGAQPGLWTLATQDHAGVNSGAAAVAAASGTKMAPLMGLPS